MISRKAFSPARRPTEYLLREDADLLSPVMVYRLTVEGFDLKDVQAMLALSELYSSRRIMSRIVGKSIRTLQRQGSKQDAHLNAQQSAMAFQFAKALGHAIKVFGSQRLAEEWLGRPCPNWLSGAAASPNQQKFADALLAEHHFVLMPSAVARHSWNLLVSCELAQGKYRLVSQERFGLDTRLVKG